MKLTKIVLLTGVLAFSAGAAFAAEVPKFKDLDGDSSKSLDEKEYAKVKEAGVTKTFEELDKNKDGKLDVNEYSVIMDEDCE
jgi:hypothetical protein